MNKSIKIAFVGDISLNGKYCEKDKEFQKKAFLDVRRFLKQSDVDILIANLESPLEGDGSVNLLKNPRLRTNLRGLEALKVLSPNIVTLANNHIYDCLETGYDNTIQWLSGNNIQYTGAFKKRSDTFKPFRVSVKGQEFSLLTYVAEDTHPSLPEGSKVHLNMFDPDRVIQNIKEELGASIIIVILHWGIGSSLYPSPVQRGLAREFVDAGARIIVGHHTHTLQGREVYGEGHIFYGLGNFAFDNLLDIKNPFFWTKDQRHSGLALVTIENGAIRESKLHVTYCDNLITRLDNSSEWNKKVNRRSSILKMKEGNYKIFWALYQFYETVMKPPFQYFLGERKNVFEQLSRLRFEHLKQFLNQVHYFLGNVRK